MKLIVFVSAILATSITTLFAAEPVKKIKIASLDILKKRKYNTVNPNSKSLVTELRLLEEFENREVLISEIPAEIDLFIVNFWQALEARKKQELSTDKFEKERDHEKNLFDGLIAQSKPDLYKVLFDEDTLNQIPEYLTLNENY